MDNYVRLSHTVEDVGDIIPLSDYEDSSKLRAILDKRPNSDWYTSLYYYPKEAKDYFSTNGRIKGYTGPANTKVILFDIDNKDLNKSQSAAIKLLEKFKSEGIDILNSCRVYFSGNKGFHVELYTSKEFSPNELKPLCRNMMYSINPLYVKKGEDKVFDSSVYNITRLMRIVNTKHQVSGLFKIELEPDELVNLSINDIKLKAKDPIPSTFVPVPLTDLTFLDKYSKMSEQMENKSVVVDVSDVDGIRGLDKIDFDKCPKNTPRCIYALSHGVMQSGIGERNLVFHKLATYYKNQGLSKDLAYNTLKGTARLNGELYPEEDAFTKEELWNTVISSVYSDSNSWKTIPGASGVDPNNEHIKRYCVAADKFTGKRCPIHHKVDNSHTVVQIDGVSDSFRNFAENFDKNTIKTGINFIDQHMNIAVGTTTLLVGATGCGKTTLALNLMENANALGQHTMFFSLDMHKNLIYLKLAQKLTNYSQKEILDFYQSKNTAKINYIKNAIGAKYGKTYFDFSSTLTMEQMRDKIFSLEEQHGNKIKLVVVDYAGRVSGPFSDTFANANYNALKSTEMANVTDAAWIIISQVSRNIGDGCSPLRTKRAAKESGSWEESASNVITCWRPFLGDTERDNVLKLYLAKNRMGKELEAPLHFDGAKGLIRDLDMTETVEYSEVREKEEKEYYKARLTKT